MSGRELFNYDAKLFVDDETGLAFDDDEDIAAEAKARELAEQKRQEEDEKRAQAEQSRLQELERYEEEVRQHTMEQRRKAAAAADHPTFSLLGVTINQVVFDVDEKENLIPFTEETLETAEPAIQA